MKFLKNIVSTLLVLAVINTVSAKALHELFEHTTKVHTCLNKDVTHFHYADFQHLDLICSFNLSSSLLTNFILDFKNVILFKKKQLKVQSCSLLANLYFNNLLLRGPPNIK